MKNTNNQPSWQEILNDALIKRSFGSFELHSLIKKAQKDYLYWDAFKYQKMPNGFTPEEAWAALKLNRTSLYQPTSIMANNGRNFQFALVNSLYQKLNYIDTYASGFIKTLSETKPSEAQKNKFIITGLTEEAIATSQIEGANTTRQAAKEMLASQRAPRTRDEQMIINSYQAMQRLDVWKDLDLSKDMLLEIQKLVTEKTLKDPNGQGRFRNDGDDIVVHDAITGEVVHTPPKEQEMHKQLERLIHFANRKEDEGDFIHPCIKASILHFWLAYLHPFVDGNGRTARTLFYWYLLKKEYWLVQYLSISRAIVQSRKRYDDAFIHSESDDNDITYFLFYIADAFKISIVKFVEYFERKLNEMERFKKVADRLESYNTRQVALLHHFMDYPNEIIDVGTHQTKQGVSRQTAHIDLMDLAKKGMLAQTVKKGTRKYIFVPNIQFIRKLFKA
ncbi:MAG: Fic family protein [Candidatus Pacebacteria bacterium]|nr:Fic family protein [Candidatus Paceibacterota bacterium]